MTSRPHIGWLLVLALGSAGCLRARQEERIVVGGSSAVLPLIRHAAAEFTRQHPTVAIDVAAGGSALGLAQVQSGAIDIGDSDTDPPAPTPTLVDHRIGATVFAIVTAAGDHLGGRTRFSKNELRQLLSGEVTDWATFGGAPGRIFVINRAPGSGTRTVLEHALFDGDSRLIASAPVEDNSGTIARTLLALPGSVSYVALPYVRPPLVALGIDDGMPTADDVVGGRYPFWSYGHMFTQTETRPVVAAFVDFVVSPEFQDRELERFFFVPLGRFAAVEPAR